MPAPAPINPKLIRALFDYNPTTGDLIPNKLAARAAVRISQYQWEVGPHKYSTHRIIWAWHNPDRPNPYAVKFHDNNMKNTRIENLYALDTNPRWVGHVKQVKMSIRSDGTVAPVGAEPQHQPPTPAPERPFVPRMSVLRAEEAEAKRREELERSLATFERDVTAEVAKSELESIVNNWD